jgi:hypothetical protein
MVKLVAGGTIPARVLRRKCPHATLLTIVGAGPPDIAVQEGNGNERNSSRVPVKRPPFLAPAPDRDVVQVFGFDSTANGNKLRK